MLSASRRRRRARSLIWRTRSRVRLSLLATSSAVISLRPMPKSIFSTWRSRSERVARAASRSDESDSFSMRLSVPGAESSVMMSMRQLLSSSWKGASTLTFLPFVPSASCTLLTSVSRISASSPTEGRRSYSCSKLTMALVSLLWKPTWLSGMRTMRLCSEMACRMLWRIHHTA